MEAKMFSLKVSEKEIQDVLGLLQTHIHPNFIVRDGFRFILALSEYGWDFRKSMSERKVRLCIAELRKRGYPVISCKKGYAIMGDDPEPAIHFVNGLYSRAHKLTQEADIMYGLIKQKYGDAVSAKVEQLPKQPVIAFPPIKESDKFHTKVYSQSEPPYRKSIDARGNEIARQFEYDA
jgi:hypothetical protein